MKLSLAKVSGTQRFIWKDVVPFIPAVLLCIVAVYQLRLTHTEYLTPWKGGAFGMFSTTDSGLNRRVDIRVRGPGIDRETEPHISLAGEIESASVLPSEKRLERIARDVAEIEGVRGVTISEVHVTVTKLRYDPSTLSPQIVHLRTVVVPISGIPKR